MARVPKATRAACACAFMNIHLKIIGDSTKISAWENLLAFRPSIVAKPSQGGVTINQANIVFKRLCDCNGTPTLHSIPTRPTRTVPIKKQDSYPAAAVTSKLEAGNFRAAIRLLCSKDKPAQTMQQHWRHSSLNTLQLHQTVNLPVNFQEMLGFSHCKSLQKT